MPENMPQNPQKIQNPSPALWIVLGAVILIIVAAFIYYGDFWESDTNLNSNLNSFSNVNSAIDPGLTFVINDSIDTTEWGVYKDEKLGFEVKYPDSFLVINNEAEGEKYVQFADRSMYPSETEFPYILIERVDAGDVNNLEVWVEDHIEDGYSQAYKEIATQFGEDAIIFESSVVSTTVAFMNDEFVYLLDIAHFVRDDVKTVGSGFINTFRIL